MKKSVIGRMWLPMYVVIGCLFFSNTIFCQHSEVLEDLPSHLDDIVERRHLTAKSPLKYAPLREADVAWERRIWRVIDVREKMNLPFVCPQSPLFENLLSAAMREEIRVFDAENDKFSRQLTLDELENVAATTDTIITFNVETGEEEVKIVHNQLNPDDVKRFRVKEVWFFDKKYK